MSFKTKEEQRKVMLGATIRQMIDENSPLPRESRKRLRRTVLHFSVGQLLGTEALEPEVSKELKAVAFAFQRLNHHGAE